MKNNFRVKCKESSNYWVRLLFRYRHAEDGNVFTTCLLFFYTPEFPLPDLNIQEASAAGFAQCIPTDQFSRAIGRKLTLTRALAESGISKSERTQIWEAYFDGKYLNG